MKYELTIYELGKLLKNIDSKYNISLLSKIKLSGGWMTMTGEISVIDVPTEAILLKGNNIITLKLKNNNENGSEIKITGLKDSKFVIDISATKYKEIKPGMLNLDVIKVNNNQCKLRIDEDMIFTIDTSVDKVIKCL
ncbi:UDP-N-acetylglucosamine pyrophosphorylase [Clostridium septicum]|uniref:UDP-N-acetylglucosamine pyrophosphorylase n=1 Tax=Clostridium septicum TaxID=1504 RepID=A0A9N7JJT5_CLOSE|nr:UDP-N-acetylglucosamine pyrophosphorylase [Clostridium septicum]AYE33249.1 UDP-N-acetylglucosamine pyrophosphorylase [Clostridium septicum]MDU1313019.1 UDP-N-acetylglucosamine pyrophosphorylase [Clostridium septicum]QAS61421.1 UDP-N-acetylglucosamine pyrophosphorylase [Clostridium septicum]UEC22147.1 UDP-N-acetylglucosamine pyrophosphorylase [Clostridium septicum]USR99822.1 UDP-N-acetylglucosamine pyrophosphorylase [Clostridium septicum]